MRYLLCLIAIFFSLETRADDAYTKKIGELETYAKSQPSEDGLRRKLEALFPVIAGALERDSRDPKLLAQWGRSLNFDEGVKATIVEPAILDLVLKLGGGPKRDGRIVHAGLEHTYGYLLNNLETSFGYKRERWTKGEIERGLRLAEGSLGPTPSEGTLLSNLTELLSEIAVEQSYKALRVTETIEKKGRTVVLYTDLVPFLEIPDDEKANSFLLVYSVKDPEQKFITAFPVNAGFVKGATDPKKLGTKVSISPRYNAYLEGIAEEKGSRVLTETQGK